MPILLRGSGPASRSQPTTSIRGSTGSQDLLKVQQEKSSSHGSGRRVDPSAAVDSIKRKIADIPKPPADWKQRLKRFYKKHHLKYLNPLVFIMIYMFLGAIIFLWLEGSADEKRTADSYFTYSREKELLLRRVEEILGDRAARARPVRRKFLNEAVDYFHNQVGFSVGNESKWDLSTAMYYAGTLFTTIGYGDVACSTTAGRILTVIYSCVGIPLMLITLNDLGKFLYESINGCVKGMEDAWTYLGVFRLCTVRRNNIDIRIDEADAAEKGEAIRDELNSLHSEMGSSNSDREEDLDEDLEEEHKMPRMSVKVALGITVGWIFFCSALFRLWEDWTYGESLYFMFISLSTIGLGDIAVEHRGMMVLCFVFVIVGLSLVSMTINVVQVAIEELYIAFLMKIIMEYQEKMAAGGDPKGASMGMMRMWGNNRTAKMLMPLLGKEKRRMAMEKVEVEAKAKGIEVPAILKEVDVETGMPKILQLQEPKDESAPLPPELEEMVERHVLEQVMEVPVSLGLSPSVASMFLPRDADTQTDIVQTEDVSEQTIQTVLEDSSAQTDSAEKNITESQMQTEQTVGREEETQTQIRVFSDAETATATVHMTENDSQTSSNPVKEQEIQTYVFEYMDAETSTSVETKNIRIQTPHPQIMDKSVQSDDLSEAKSHSPSKMSSARKRIRRALRITSRQRRNTLGETPAMSDWVEGPSDVGEEMEGEGSVESLHWDPVDGLHAEKQLPVQRLKAMFDRKTSH